jgi:hypothetical protein
LNAPRRVSEAYDIVPGATDDPKENDAGRGRELAWRDYIWCPGTRPCDAVRSGPRRPAPIQYTNREWWGMPGSGGDWRYRGGIPKPYGDQS